MREPCTDCKRSRGNILASGGGHPAQRNISKFEQFVNSRHTLIPTLRRLRNVLIIVDILLDVQWLLRSKECNVRVEGGFGSAFLVLA